MKEKISPQQGSPGGRLKKSKGLIIAEGRGGLLALKTVLGLKSVAKKNAGGRFSKGPWPAVLKKGNSK